MIIEVYADLCCTVGFEVYQSKLIYKVISHFGIDEATGKQCYRDKLAINEDVPTYILNDAIIDFHGDISWDGCQNISFSNNVQFHLCGREGLLNFQAILTMLYKRASELIPNFDKDEVIE